ncbi:MAG: LPS export ABC transporter permease LptF [Pseudolabrys sp.]|nr:LPS export ABC transporter permease LptF [Pseudolabrys sp.]
MGSIGRYIFRTTFGAFLMILISLTAVIWITQALRDIDLLTNQGQSVFVFVGITSLIIPLLVLVIAPIALFIAASHTLNKLSTDSEIIVMNAAGISPWILFRTFIPVTLVVSLLVGLTSAYFAPQGLRMLRDWLTAVKANVVSNVVQPGRFVTIESGVTMHIRARLPNGQLLGVFMDDRRNPDERVTILADAGDLLENDSGTFLILRSGTVQRYQANRRDPSFVSFDRYALDLSRFAAGPAAVKYSIRERYLWQLIWPDPQDPWLAEQPGQFRAELHDRLIAPLYPIAFIIIAFAYLAPPRTTRESRTTSLLGAIGMMTLVRMLGFVSSVMGAHNPLFLLVQYAVVLGAIGGGLFVIHRGIVIEAPQFVSQTISFVTERLTRRFATP